MIFAIRLKPQPFAGYLLGEGGGGLWEWVRPTSIKARRFDTRAEAELALTELPMRVRKDAAICEFPAQGGDIK